MEAKKHRFFKVAFDINEAAIFDCKTLITLKEAHERSIDFYGENPKICVAISPNLVIDALKLGLPLMEMSLGKKSGFVIGRILDVKVL